MHQLTDGVCPEELKKAGLGEYYTDHGVDVYPQSAGGVPFNATCLACKGDAVANLQENLAAEQKARATYEKLIDLCCDDPDVVDPLRFLRQREIVHFQRFGEALRGVQDKLAQKNFNMNNFNMEKEKCNCMNEFDSVNNYNTSDAVCNCNNDNMCNNNMTPYNNFNNGCNSYR